MVEQYTYKKISIKKIIEMREIFEKNNIPLWRKKKSGEWVTVPLHRLEQFFGNDTAADPELFIEPDWKEKIHDAGDKPEKERETPHKSGTVHIIDEEKKSDETTPDKKTNIDKRYRETLQNIKKIPPETREKLFDQNLADLEKKAKNSHDIDFDSISSMVASTADAFCMNRVALEESVEKQDKKAIKHIKQISDKSHRLVDSIISIIKKSEQSYSYLSILENKSTGSTLDHMNNVFLRFIPFALYYNSTFHNHKIFQISILFDKTFHRYYQKLLPGHYNITMQNVFKGGLRELTDLELHEYSLGALLHDIGKVYDIDYFEGSQEYDRKKIIAHVPVGYNLLVKSGEFYKNIPLLAALHHEYYGSSAGYKITEQLFPDKNKHHADASYCISYNINDIQDGNSLAFFPAKMLEIVDVFDALTDRKRKYREKKLSAKDALWIMKTEFIAKEIKIDPLLFYLFVDFFNVNSIIDDLPSINKLLML